MTCDNIRLVTKCERKQFITAYQTAAIKQTLDKQTEAQSIRDSTPTVLKSMETPLNNVFRVVSGITRGRYMIFFIHVCFHNELAFILSV